MRLFPASDEDRLELCVDIDPRFDQSKHTKKHRDFFRRFSFHECRWVKSNYRLFFLRMFAQTREESRYCWSIREFRLLFNRSESIGNIAAERLDFVNFISKKFRKLNALLFFKTVIIICNSKMRFKFCWQLFQDFVSTSIEIDWVVILFLTLQKPDIYGVDCMIKLFRNRKI